MKTEWRAVDLFFCLYSLSHKTHTESLSRKFKLLATVFKTKTLWFLAWFCDPPQDCNNIIPIWLHSLSGRQSICPCSCPLFLPKTSTFNPSFNSVEKPEQHSHLMDSSYACISCMLEHQADILDLPMSLSNSPDVLLIESMNLNQLRQGQRAGASSCLLGTLISHCSKYQDVEEVVHIGSWIHKDL